MATLSSQTDEKLVFVAKTPSCASLRQRTEPAVVQPGSGTTAGTGLEATFTLRVPAPISPRPPMTNAPPAIRTRVAWRHPFQPPRRMPTR
jgi:hypothetical protein